ncbi:MAG: OprD family porin [bacterium]|nr:OprD family porin [bacterium]
MSWRLGRWMMVVALLLPGAAPATDYVEAESTATERIEHATTPLTYALGRARERRAKRREWLKDAPPFWKDARLDLHSRTYGFERLDPDGARHETWATGGWLAFESGRFRERLAVGATLHTSQKLYGPQDRDGLFMLRPRQTGLTVLGEAWADLRLDDQTSFRAWRQKLDLPYLNGQDSRMIPNTFQAYVLRRRAENVGFVAGHVSHMKRRSSREFASMAEAAGVDAERGLSVVGARWAPREGFYIGALNLVAWDLMNTVYGEAQVSHTFANELSLILRGQLTHQSSIGDERLLGGSFSTQHLGLKGQLAYRGVKLSLMGGSTGHGAAIRSPWGGRPGFLSLMREDFDRAGERAFGLGLDVDFARVGADGWSGFLRFARGRGGENAASGVELPTRWELDATLDYRPETGLLENFWLRLRFATLNERGASRTGRDVRVIVNYDIPIL